MLKKIREISCKFPYASIRWKVNKFQLKMEIHVGFKTDSIVNYQYLCMGNSKGFDKPDTSHQSKGNYF